MGKYSIRKEFWIILAKAVGFLLVGIGLIGVWLSTQIWE